MDYEKLSSENFETFKEIKLEITESHDDKNYMICFEGDNLKIIYAYNNAIHAILEKYNLKHFHQIGNGEEDTYHGWEIWERNNPKLEKTLQNLLPEIQNEAKKEYENLKNIFNLNKS